MRLHWQPAPLAKSEKAQEFHVFKDVCFGTVKLVDGRYACTRTYVSEQKFSIVLCVDHMVQVFWRSRFSVNRLKTCRTFTR